jgi:hypothetical protein
VINPYTKTIAAFLIVCFTGLASSTSLAQNAGTNAPMTESIVATPRPSCDCGNRVGLSRWAHHKSHCKQKLKREVIGIPDEYIETALGASVHATFQTQVTNGDNSRMVINHYDFVTNTAELNLRGQDKLRMIAGMLPTSFAPVVIERTEKTPRLDESRRRTIIAALEHSLFPIPAERVVVGPPISAGRNGTEALILDAARLGALQAGSTQPFSAAGGGSPSGFDSSGLTGSAIQSSPR